MWHDDSTNNADQLLYSVFVAILTPWKPQTNQNVALIGLDMDILKKKPIVENYLLCSQQINPLIRYKELSWFFLKNNSPVFIVIVIRAEGFRERNIFDQYHLGELFFLLICYRRKKSSPR